MRKDHHMSQSPTGEQPHGGAMQLISGLLLIPAGAFISLRGLDSDDITQAVVGALVVASGAINAVYASLRRFRQDRGVRPKDRSS